MNIKALRQFCEVSPLVCHNAKFETKWLLSRGINPNIVDDTFLLAYLYDERLSLDLESLCLRFEIDKAFKEDYGLDVAKLEGQELINRNTKDSRNTILLRNKLKPLLTKEELYVYNTILLPATKTFAKIENEGICISPQEIERLIVDIDKKIIDLDLKNDEYIKTFETISGKKFNVNSYLHRGILIYDLLGYTPLPYAQAETYSHEPSTENKILKKLLDIRETDTLRKIVKYSSLVGWKETYESLGSICEKCNKSHIDKIGDNHFVFTNLRLGETTTGRIKSDHPNMQNTPAREGQWTRRVFISRHKHGLIVECDYDQIELRLIAGISRDERLLEEFSMGLDPHVEMAKLAFNKKNITKMDRFWGKTLNYAIPFGSGASRVAFETGRSLGEAYTWLNRYWKAHPKLREYLNNIPLKLY